MLQTVIAYIIIAAAVCLTIVYIFRMFIHLGRKESSCAYCDHKKSCKMLKD